MAPCGPRREDVGHGRGTPRRERGATPLLEYSRRAALGGGARVQGAAQSESTALLLARLGITGGENVLEIGCGTGALTVPLAAAIGNHGRLVAIDISEPMLGVARQRVQEHGLHNIKLLLGDAQVFDFEPGTFDLATSRMGVMFFGN